MTTDHSLEEKIRSCRSSTQPRLRRSSNSTSWVRVRILGGRNAERSWFLEDWSSPSRSSWGGAPGGRERLFTGGL